ncbi:putative membrane protein [Sorangium cellulosum So ce56]|uniref:Membrane protein n=1 Tax=Sorangium cellulosum (strain So ce56) TaxID=448385 RepID=A9GE81_SORC5|nr:serine protease [Sorangium cellulosum]CAN99455.1 putative membrane protein [Sorangium cellulosum So ce56]
MAWTSACVRIEAEDACLGTGFLVAPQWIVTCAHLLWREDPATKQRLTPRTRVRVRFSDLAGTFEASAVAADDVQDIALLRLDTPLMSRRPAQMEDAPLSRGERVRLFGYPGFAGQQRPEDPLYGIAVDGEVSHVTQEYAQLIALQAVNGPVDGFSGSPVVVGEIVRGYFVACFGGVQRVAHGVLAIYPIRHAIEMLVRETSEEEWIELNDRGGGVKLRTTELCVRGAAADPVVTIPLAVLGEALVVGVPTVVVVVHFFDVAGDERACVAVEKTEACKRVLAALPEYARPREHLGSQPDLDHALLVPPVERCAAHDDHGHKEIVILDLEGREITQGREGSELRERILASACVRRCCVDALARVVGRRLGPTVETLVLLATIIAMFVGLYEKRFRFPVLAALLCAFAWSIARLPVQRAFLRMLGPEKRSALAKRQLVRCSVLTRDEGTPILLGVTFASARRPPILPTDSLGRLFHLLIFAGLLGDIANGVRTWIAVAARDPDGGHRFGGFFVGFVFPLMGGMIVGLVLGFPVGDSLETRLRRSGIGLVLLGGAVAIAAAAALLMDVEYFILVRSAGP